jgi:hypothetical protein
LSCLSTILILKISYSNRQEKTEMQIVNKTAPAFSRLVYRVAGQIIAVDAMDAWAKEVIENFFAGWYLDPETERVQSPAPAIVIRRDIESPQIPVDWQPFEIAGGGTCRTDGCASYLDIEGSIIAVGATGLADVEVWLHESLEVQSPSLTRVVTYALSAALRRRKLFELHSAALVDPVSGIGFLVIGPSGSGKSTLAVHLASAGWPFLTDDVLVLCCEGARVSAWPLRRCFAVTADTFAASPFSRNEHFSIIRTPRAPTSDYLYPTRFSFPIFNRPAFRKGSYFRR